jgi:uncharacterized protein YukE
MSGSSIILEPKQMFQTLQDMEKATQDILKLIQDVSAVLEAVSVLTFAFGFGQLIKLAEQAINQVGNAVVAANNAFNSACRDVVNQLVDKFASEGAKSDYGSPAFIEITVKINVADRAQIYPPAMRALFDDHQQKNQQIGNKTNDMRDIYRSTSNFWIGSSADKTRSSFESKIVPQFEDLLSVLQQIVSLGLDWVEDAVKFEASLGV